MKILLEKTNKQGRRVVTVGLEEGEQLLAIHPARFYQLGDPMDDVVGGYILTGMRPAVWCSISQKWVT